jgi:hypothetical protein
MKRLLALCAALAILASPLGALAALDVDFEDYTPGVPLRDQGWGGLDDPASDNKSGPSEQHVIAPPGSGNDSDYCMSAIPNDPETPDYNEGYVTVGWTYVEASPFATDDVVCYSAWMRNNSVGFLPVNTEGGTNDKDTYSPWYKQGPFVSAQFDSSGYRYRQRRVNGDNWNSTNYNKQGGDWVEMRMVIDPRRDIDGTPEEGSYGVGHFYVRNVTQGETDWTKLVFDNMTTSGDVEAVEQMPLALTGDHPIAGEGGHKRNPAYFDGWEIYSYDNGYAVDNLTAFEVVLGDFDGNGAVNGLDIPGFKAALADSDGWWADNGDNFDPDLLGDFDGNGAFNGLDIPGFKNALAGTAVPEPATLMLLALGAGALIRRRR